MSNGTETIKDLLASRRRGIKRDRVGSRVMVERHILAVVELHQAPLFPESQLTRGNDNQICQTI